MCGIAGFFGSRPIAPATRQAMLAAMRQRGPDAQHETVWGADGARVGDEDMATIGLLHARLAIRDPRPCADQPMRSEDGQVWLCYNGEVYGWEEEARALQRDGAIFHTTSDTEFILRGYEAWGFAALLPRLRGMFALAIYDARLGRVFLARDRMGLKPLVYGVDEGGLVFGSTVRTVLPWLPPERRQFDGAAIDAYLAHRYVPAPRTIFTHLQRLENAHALEYDIASGKLSKTRYWQPQAGPRVTAQQALRELDTAVALRTVADRPLGVFLSGGIDSSCIANRLSVLGHAELASFTASFPGTAFDESTEAAEIARTLHMQNLPLPVPTRLGDDFARIVADLDEPFADPSSFPTWYLARETVKHVTVVLGGDGGDEVFAGYKRHPKHLRTGWRRPFAVPVPASRSLAGKGWAKLADELRLPWQQAYTLRFSGFTPAQRRYLSGKPLPSNVYWRVPDVSESTPIKQLLALDFANTLPEYILRKADLCTMAHGLELRAPLLDHVWLEKLFNVADGERFTRPAKQMLAAAMGELAALDLFNRKKRGFNPPLKDWLRSDLAARLPGLGQRLQDLTQGRLLASAVDAFAKAYLAGDEALAEQLLQLLILDASLGQLAVLVKEGAHG